MTVQFKGNIDLEKLTIVIETNGADKIAFVRLEAGTNLIGGQPFALRKYAVKSVKYVTNMSLIVGTRC